MKNADTLSIMEALDIERGNSLTESVTANTKKTTSKKPYINEAAVRRAKAKRLREADEGIDKDDEDLVDGVSDDVMVVVNPDLTTDDLSDEAADAQDIIDDTEPGEIPTDDELVGDDIKQCPICGNNFTDGEDLTAGDPCPVCGGVPEDFVTKGEIAPLDADEDDDLDGLGDEDNTDDEDAGTVAAEALKRKVAKARMEARKIAKGPSYVFEEKEFNSLMQAHLKREYSKVESFRCKTVNLKATKSGGNVLTLECVIGLKGGKTKAVKFESRAFRLRESVTLGIVETTSVIKAESVDGTKPFTLSLKFDKGVIKCESLRYSYSKRVSESKRQVISGKVIKESVSKTKKKSK